MISPAMSGNGREPRRIARAYKWAELELDGHARIPAGCLIGFAIWIVHQGLHDHRGNPFVGFHKMDFNSLGGIKHHVKMN